MEIKSEKHGPVTVVAVAGNLDASTAPKLNDYFNNALESGAIKIVVDLTELSYTSSAGLRVLLNTTKDARKKGGDLRIASVQPAVTKVFELSGFTSILKFFPDVALGVASFS